MKKREMHQHGKKEEQKLCVQPMPLAWAFIKTMYALSCTIPFSSPWKTTFKRQGELGEMVTLHAASFFSVSETESKN